MSCSSHTGASLSPDITIRQASSTADIAAVAVLFQEYTKWLNVDISFQDYASEVGNLPGKYSAPDGALLVAEDSASQVILGCVALRPLAVQPEYQSSWPSTTRYCEIKRLYVSPKIRGRQVARKLIREVLSIAIGAGYEEMLLDTLSRMEAAIALYKSEGFVEVRPYCHNPLDGVIYLGKKLDITAGN